MRVPRFMAWTERRGDTSGWYVETRVPVSLFTWLALHTPGLSRRARMRLRLRLAGGPDSGWSGDGTAGDREPRRPLPSSGSPAMMLPLPDAEAAP